MQASMAQRVLFAVGLALILTTIALLGVMITVDSLRMMDSLFAGAMYTLMASLVVNTATLLMRD